jgi:hypothetical protein
MSKYAKRLDKSRPYGSYHPPEPGKVDGDAACHFNQDGYDFDHNGEIVEWRLNDAQKAALKKKPPTAPAKQHTPKPPKPQGDGGEGAEDEGADEHADGLNLEAWLRGEEDYDFGAVQKAIKERYHVHKTSKRDMILFLVEDQKLVEESVLSDQFKAVIG